MSNVVQTHLKLLCEALKLVDCQNVGSIYATVKKMKSHNPGSKVSKFVTPFLSISYPIMVREWPSCWSISGIFSVIVIWGIFKDSNAFFGVVWDASLTEK